MQSAKEGAFCTDPVFGRRTIAVHLDSAHITDAKAGCPV